MIMNSCVVHVPAEGEVKVYIGFKSVKQAEKFIAMQDKPEEYMMAKYQKPRELPAW
jgi:hypothetical protein